MSKKEREPSKISAAVLNVLKTPWRPETFSLFTENFTEECRDRRTQPSYYFHRTKGNLSEDVCGLRAGDVLGLHKEGEFGSLSKRDGDTVVLNEHAQHAFIDFCTETYAAWHRYQERLVEIEKASGPVRRQY